MMKVLILKITLIHCSGDLIALQLTKKKEEYILLTINHRIPIKWANLKLFQS